MCVYTFVCVCTLEIVTGPSSLWGHVVRGGPGSGATDLWERRGDLFTDEDPPFWVDPEHRHGPSFLYSLFFFLFTRTVRPFGLKFPGRVSKEDILSPRSLQTGPPRSTSTFHSVTGRRLTGDASTRESKGWRGGETSLLR